MTEFQNRASVDEVSNLVNVGRSSLVYWLLLAGSTLKLQFRLVTRNIEDLTFTIVMPLQTFVTIPFFKAAGRLDLAPYALTSSLLFTVGQMGFFVGAEIITKDRKEQILQLLAASPAPYSLTLTTRIVMVCMIGLLGFFESWIIAVFVFNVDVAIYHPIVLTLSLILTAIVGGFTAVLVSALFSLAKNVRTFQNAINGPLYLLGGVLVPTSYLPAWLQLLSPFVFFYWPANLIRDTLAPEVILSLGYRLGTLASLGLLALITGVWLVQVMLKRLRVTGDIVMNRYVDVYVSGFKLGIKDFLEFWTLKSWLGGWMVRIICNIFVWVYLGKLAGAPNTITYLVIGNCATAALGNFAAVVPSWERFSGTLPLLVAAPTPIWLPIVGRMSVWAVSWLATSAICLHFALPA